MFETKRDLEFRLKSTIVFYKGKYRYVEQCGGQKPNWKLKLGGVDDIVNLDDPDLLIRNIPTGYVNLSGRLVFISRRPTRRYRQGIRHDNCYVSCGYDRFLHIVLRGYESVLSEEFTVYSSDFVRVGNKLYYRNRLVGAVEDEVISLHKDKLFLKEHLLRSVK